VPTASRAPSSDGNGGRRRRRRRDEPQFRSYYDQPVLNSPTWEAPDIPGYLFLGGLAGASSVIGAAAHLTDRPSLARTSKVGATAAGLLSVAALVHDLGRPERFLNMLRVFKVTSPMSVGSWLLAAFVPSAAVAALSELTGVAKPLGALATAASAALGMPVATYTAALVSDTAVPAWHDGHKTMPFVFAASALSAAAGLGLAGAPTEEASPLRALAVAAGAGELALTKAMEHEAGLAKETYEEGKAGRYLRLAEALTAGGVVTAATSGRSRLRAAASGAMLLAGSALTRFGIFEAGVASSKDPKYTVVPQRRRLEQEQATA
jgi:hypothetical protein